MDYVPVENPETKGRVKSIFCFLIAPDMQRKGIATMLLHRVCEDAYKEGFQYIEVYPYEPGTYQSSNFGGYYEMYHKHGFEVVSDNGKDLVMQKRL